MKMFIWDDPIDLKFGGSIAYAVAETVEEARQYIKDAKVSMYGHTPQKNKHELDVDHEPVRVLDIPCGEIYGWAE